MDYQDFPIDFNPDDDQEIPMFHHPCVLDCHTDVGLVSLMMDRKHPQYLLVSIDGELRKCLHLNGAEFHFNDDWQVVEFLKEISSSKLLDDLIEEEKGMNEGWDSL